MKKICVVFSLFLTNCAFLGFLTKNQPPFFVDAFIPMHQSEMVAYRDLQLNWDAQDPENDQLFYDVYFAKQSDPLQQMSKKQTETHYKIFFPLEAETKYHWKIVVTDGKNRVESDTLLFQTSYFFPEWWAKQDGDVYYYGIAANDRQRYAYSLAEKNAEKNKSEFLAEIVQEDMDRFIKEAGIFNVTLLKMAEQIIPIVANHDFVEAKVDLQETKQVRPDYYRTYIRVTIPRQEYEKKLLSAIRSARYLYQELSFSQSFRQLDVTYK